MRPRFEESTGFVRLEEPTYCDHCGNLTYKEERGNYVKIQDDSHTLFANYLLYRCEICDDLILQRVNLQLPEDYIGSKQLHNRLSAAEVTEVEQLWPPSLTLPPEAPARVREIYEEARTVMRRSPSSFVVQIGRALEAVTKDKDAEGHTLSHRLDWLVRERHIPQVFGEMAHINRIFRNWGAHDAELNVEPEDIEIVDEFFKAIIEYLYVAPAKVNRVKSLISQRQ